MPEDEGDALPRNEVVAAGRYELDCRDRRRALGLNGALGLNEAFGARRPRSDASEGRGRRSNSIAALAGASII